MKRTLFILSSVLCLLASFSLAQTSNVEVVRAWTRTHVMGIPGGTLLDPSGTIADGQRMAAAAASISASSNLVAASGIGLTNALWRLYAVTNRITEFTARLYIAADIDSDPGYENVEAYQISEEYGTNGVIHEFIHYTRELATPPKTVWNFELEGGGGFWADGIVATNNVTTNVLGYACYDIAVTKPAGVGNVVLRTRKFLKFGAPSIPIDIPDAGFQIVAGGFTNTPFTGSFTYTNAVGSVSNAITETYLSGLLYTVTTNSLGGNP